jgi:hypothetical protein
MSLIPYKLKSNNPSKVKIMKRLKDKVALFVDGGMAQI